MKVKSIILVLLICSTMNSLFAASKKLVEEKNSYKGKTIEVVYSEGDDKFEQFSKEVVYFNRFGKVMEQLVILKEEISEKSGIAAQRVYRNRKGEPFKYIMFYNDQYREIKGVDVAVEFVDKDDRVTKLGFFKDEQLVLEDFGPSAGMEQKFPLMRLNYLQAVFQASFDEDYEVIEEGASRLTIDLRYQKARSLVKFANKIESLDDSDRRAIANFMKSVEAEGLDEIFKHKILVEEDGKEFWLLFQEDLLEYLKEDAKILVEYHLIGVDGILYLIGGGFREESSFIATK